MEDQQLVPGNKPKQWKEYALEFLLIFLAVTLGFFAENLREYFADVQTGNEYVVSLKEDLTKDVAIIDAVLVIVQRDVATSDTLIKYLRKEGMYAANDLQQMYGANLNAMGGFSTVLTDRTSSQLKNSGGMRLIRKKDVANGLTDYWQNFEVLADVANSSTELRVLARQKSYLIFDSKYYSDKTDEKGTRQIVAGVHLMTNDHMQLTEFTNVLTHFKNTLSGPFTRYLTIQKNSATELIKTIDREYELN